MGHSTRPAPGGSRAQDLLRAEAAGVSEDVELAEAPRRQLRQAANQVGHADVDLALAFRRHLVLHGHRRLDPAVLALPLDNLTGHGLLGDACARQGRAARAPLALVLALALAHALAEVHAAHGAEPSQRVEANLQREPCAEGRHHGALAAPTALALAALAALAAHLQREGHGGCCGPVLRMRVPGPGGEPKLEPK